MVVFHSELLVDQAGYPLQNPKPKGVGLYKPQHLQGPEVWVVNMMLTQILKAP